MQLVFILVLSMLIITFIIDASGFVEQFKRRIFKFLNPGRTEYKSFSMKPFDCSLCATFWTCIIISGIYLYQNVEWSWDFLLQCLIYGAISCGLSLFAPVVGQFLVFLSDFFSATIDMIYEKLEGDQKDDFRNVD